MTQFLQLHALTSYPAANLNRDDAGRPKTMMFGAAERLRISSQSLKRAWRTAPEFRAAVGEDHIGKRSQEFAHDLLTTLKTKGVTEDQAIARVRYVIETNKLGKLEKLENPEKNNAAASNRRGKKAAAIDPGEASEIKLQKPIDTNQLVHLSHDEIARLTALADLLSSNANPDAKEIAILSAHPKAVDIAMFGRMLADNSGFNVEAAVQVAHAFTTHRISVEDDFYTAVDDLKKERPGADAGAGFLGNFEFGSGVFYHYLCIDTGLLLANLHNAADLAQNAVAGLIEAVAIANPKGKQSSTAAHPRAQYLRIEVGERAPRTLANAFLRPAQAHGGEGDLLTASIDLLDKHHAALDQAYGACTRDSTVMQVGGAGSLADCIAFARRHVG